MSYLEKFSAKGDRRKHDREGIRITGNITGKTEKERNKGTSVYGHRQSKRKILERHATVCIREEVRVIAEQEYQRCQR